MLRVELILILSGSCWVWVEFCRLQVEIGYIGCFSKEKSRILHGMKNYIFGYQWIYIHIYFSDIIDIIVYYFFMIAFKYGLILLYLIVQYKRNEYPNSIFIFGSWVAVGFKYFKLKCAMSLVEKIMSNSGPLLGRRKLFCRIQVWFQIDFKRNVQDPITYSSYVKYSNVNSSMSKAH